MKWTPEKIEELRRRYPHEDNGALAREFGCSRKALVFRASHLRLRKTEAANEARYAAMSRRPAPPGEEGERRQIATGTVIVRGNILTHLSNFSAAHEQAKTMTGEEGAEESAAPDDECAREGTTRNEEGTDFTLERRGREACRLEPRNSGHFPRPEGPHPSPLSSAAAASSPFSSAR